MTTFKGLGQSHELLCWIRIAFIHISSYLTVKCRLTGHWRWHLHTMSSVVWNIYIHVILLWSTAISSYRMYWLATNLWLRWAGLTVCDCFIKYCVIISIYILAVFPDMFSIASHYKLPHETQNIYSSLIRTKSVLKHHEHVVASSKVFQYKLERYCPVDKTI